MKRLIVLLALVASLSATLLAVGPAHADYSPAADLNAAFGAGCSTTGNFSSTIDANAAVLKGMLDSMKSDDACKGLTPLFESVSADIAGSVDVRNDDKAIEESTLGYINDLNAAIAAEEVNPAKDPDYLMSLRTELQSKKIFLLQTKAREDYTTRSGSHQKVKHLYLSTSALMDGLLNNTACAGKHPNVLAQIGAQVLRLSSNYASGLTGTTLIAAGTIVDKLVMFVRDLKLAKPMNDLEQESLGRALGCTFEKLSSTYCQARDVQLVAEKHARIQSVPSCEWKGVDVVGRDLPSFVGWVSRLYAGSEPSSSSQANDKQSATNIKYQLDTMDNTIKGFLADTQRELDQQSDPEQKQRVLIAFVDRKLNPTIMANTGRTMYDQNNVPTVMPGPFSGTFAEDPACGAVTYFFTNGVSRKCPIQNGESCLACVRRAYPDLAPLEFGKIVSLWDNLRIEATRNVSNREILVKEQNPELVLTLAEDVGANQRRPRDFLENAGAYLRGLLASEGSIGRGATRKTIELALKKTNCAIEYLDAYIGQPPAPGSSFCPTEPEGTEKNAQYYVTRLSGLLAPSGDTNSLPKEIKAIVKRDIDHKIAEGKIDETLAALMKLSTTDSVSEFLKDYDRNLDLLDIHITSVKSATKRQLKTVWDVFGEDVENRLKSLKADRDRSAQRTLSLECARLLVMPFGESFGGKVLKMPDDIKKQCGGKKHASIYNQSNLVIDFDALYEKPFEERVCSVYDFFRKSKLYSQKQPGSAK